MTRNSSIELLRIVLMLMITIHHCIVHGLGLTSLQPAFGSVSVIQESWMPMAIFVNCFCICAVNCFVLISGYFGINTGSKKIKILIFTLIFYTISLCIIPQLAQSEYNKALYRCLILSNSQYWFMIDYLFLMAFAPVLNSAFENLSSKKVHLFVIALIVISCYFGFIWKHGANYDGYTIMQFILMYSIGRIIHRFDYNLTKLKSFCGYAVCSAICGFLMYGLYRLNQPIFAWHITYYNNPFLIFAAVFLFLFFKNFTIHSKTINLLAKSALGIYLFQSSYIMSSYRNKFLKEIAISESGWIVIVSILGVSIFTVIIAISFDRIRIALSEKIFKTSSHNKSSSISYEMGSK